MASFQEKFSRRLSSFWAIFKSLLARHGSLLLVLLLSVFLPLQLFGQLAEEVWENDVGFTWDESILLAIRQTANPWLDQFAIFTTKLGVFWGVFPVATAISLRFLLKRRWYSLTYLLVTSLGSIVINRSVKVLLHRVRPHLWASPAPEFDYGFPSGHAMSSMTFVAILVILTWHTRWRWWVLLLGGLFVLLIGWTRLYLGVHYPSDILAGWLASIAWASGVSLLIRPQREVKLAEQQK